MMNTGKSLYIHHLPVNLSTYIGMQISCRRLFISVGNLPLFVKTFLACIFCFPISDHVKLPLGTVSLKCRPTHVNPSRAYV